MSRIHAAVLLVLMVASTPCMAHTDLQLQIDNLNHELTGDPANTELLMKRGDLHRRHQDWTLARDDFARVRQIEPGHAYIDWFTGRLEVEAGEPQKGVALLDEFLKHKPQHLIARQNRAQGYLLLGQPLPAANDYRAVILHSKTPGPELYRACASAYLAAGETYDEQAMDIVRQGLTRIPGEISLTGLGTDISLARSDLDTAQTLIDSLPGPVMGLAHWKVRGALLDCLSGRSEAAAKGFADAIDDPSNTPKRSSWITHEWLEKLAVNPTPENCREFVRDFRQPPHAD